MRAATVQRIAFAALLVALAVLAATGAWLWFNYRPSAPAPWADLPAAARSSVAVAAAHRVAAYAAVASAAVVMVVGLVGRRPWAPAAALVPVLLVATVTGYLLPWDQLALWAVRVPIDLDGMAPAAFDGSVRFILVGNVEVTQATFRKWLIVHTGGLAALGGVLAGHLAWRLRAARPAPPPP